MAPLVKVLEQQADLDSRVCVTAQHREMLDQVLELFSITPDYDLDIMKENQTLYDVTSNVLLGMQKVLEDYQPDVVLVHGDPWGLQALVNCMEKFPDEGYGLCSLEQDPGQKISL